MYPYDIIPGINLYVIFICVGLVACFLIFSKLSDKIRLKAKIHNLALLCGIFGIGAGLGASVIFQALYNIVTVGRFEITDETGATFYGGLIGGAAAFLLIYFIVGHFKIKDRIYLDSFFPMVSCIAPAIAVAHGFGRLGCLMAGCCHGKLTDSFLGIMMYGNMGYDKYVPTQLFEAMFLFSVGALMIIRSVSKKGYNLSIYLMAYGVWRFVIEYARADYRGNTFVSFLTPSQLTAIILIIVGVVLIFIEKRARQAEDQPMKPSEEISDE